MYYFKNTRSFFALKLINVVSKRSLSSGSKHLIKFYVSHMIEQCQKLKKGRSNHVLITSQLRHSDSEVDFLIKF